MSTTTTFHIRAFACAGAHFIFCAVLGVTVLVFVVADVMTTSSELPPPWWITGGHWLLMMLSAPTAAFFGFWKDPGWSRLTSLLMALGWSLLLGYLVSSIWSSIEKAAAKRENKVLQPTTAALGSWAKLERK